jgi:hypothetical protein
MKIMIGVLVGGGIGFLIGYFGKCSTGTCPLTSNPWTSMVMGAMVGFISAIG